MNICSQGRKLLNFLTFKLIIIQFVICVSFSGFSTLTKVIPTARFYRKTTWIQTMTTRNDTTTNHSNNDASFSTNKVYPTAYRAMYPTTCSQHTEQRIIPNDVPNNSQTTYHTTYQTPNNNQPAGLSDDLPKDLSNLSNNMTNRTACKSYNNQPLGATKSSSVKKLNDTVSRREACSLAVFFSFLRS